MNNLNKCILIVEDDVDQCDAFVDLIGIIDNSISIITSNEPTEAVKHCEHNKFNLIFTDFRMPNLSGMSFIEIIKNIKIQKNTPVIVVTGYINDVVTDKILRTGAIRVINKPFNKNTIIECLELMS